MLEWVAVPSPGDLPDPGMEPRSPAVQADSLSADPPGKPGGAGWARRKTKRRRRPGHQGRQPLDTRQRPEMRPEALPLNLVTRVPGTLSATNE